MWSDVGLIWPSGYTWPGREISVTPDTLKIFLSYISQNLASFPSLKKFGKFWEIFHLKFFRNFYDKKIGKRLYRGGLRKIRNTLKGTPLYEKTYPRKTLKAQTGNDSMAQNHSYRDRLHIEVGITMWYNSTILHTMEELHRRKKCSHGKDLDVSGKGFHCLKELV